jgi:hypothetical protein
MFKFVKSNRSHVKNGQGVFTIPKSFYGQTIKKKSEINKLACANKKNGIENTLNSANVKPYPHRDIQASQCKRKLDIDRIESC